MPLEPVTIDNFIHDLGDLARFRELTDLEGSDWLLFLRNFVFQLVDACRPYMGDAEKEMVLPVPCVD